MSGPYRTLVVEHHGDVVCARLRHAQFEESEVHQIGDELLDLVDGGCRKLVFDLASETPNLIYSIFVGKLLAVRRRLLDLGGEIKLAAASPHVRGVFDALQLLPYFDFYPDQAAAIAAFVEGDGAANG